MNGAPPDGHEAHSDRLGKGCGVAHGNNDDVPQSMLPPLLLAACPMQAEERAEKGCGAPQAHVVIRERNMAVEKVGQTEE